MVLISGWGARLPSTSCISIPVAFFTTSLHYHCKQTKTTLKWSASGVGNLPANKVAGPV